MISVVGRTFFKKTYFKEQGEACKPGLRQTSGDCYLADPPPPGKWIVCIYTYIKMAGKLQSLELLIKEVLYI